MVWRGNFRWSCQFHLPTLLWGAIVRRRAADQNENVSLVCSFKFLLVRLTGAKETGVINFSTPPFSMRVVFKTILSVQRLKDLFLSCLASLVLHGFFLPSSSFTWWPAPSSGWMSTWTVEPVPFSAVLFKGKEHLSSCKPALVCLPYLPHTTFFWRGIGRTLYFRPKSLQREQDTSFQLWMGCWNALQGSCFGQELPGDWLTFPFCSQPRTSFLHLGSCCSSNGCKRNGDTFCLIQHNKIAPLYYKTNTNGCPWDIVHLGRTVFTTQHVLYIQREYLSYQLNSNPKWWAVIVLSPITS